jgi:hypothetical protein
MLDLASRCRAMDADAIHSSNRGGMVLIMTAAKVVEVVCGLMGARDEIST